MRNKTELSLLLDYYGAFLTDNQRELITMSANEDLSLGEIAEAKGISRQGVRDSLVRSEKLLLDMEEKLGLAARDRRALAIINKLSGALERSDIDRTELRQMLNELTAVMEGSNGI